MVALIILALLSAGTFDTNNVMEFIWTPALGNVDHYDVYVSLDGGDFNLISSSTTCSIAFYQSQVGSQVVVKVQAVDALGSTGPMSEVSDPVWRVSKPIRQLRSG